MFKFNRFLYWSTSQRASWVLESLKKRASQILYLRHVWSVAHVWDWVRDLRSYCWFHCAGGLCTDQWYKDSCTLQSPQTNERSVTYVFVTNATDGSQSNTSPGECDDCMTDGLCCNHENKSDVRAGRSWALVSSTVFQWSCQSKYEKNPETQDTRPKSIIKSIKDPRSTFKGRSTLKWRKNVLPLLLVSVKWVSPWWLILQSNLEWL